MLYSEFLNGTYEQDNPWTYKEYKRIEAIYNDNDEMTKEAAYKLFREPDDFTKELLEELTDVKNSKSVYRARVEKLEKDIKALEDTLRSKDTVINSLNYTMQEMLTETKRSVQRMSDMIYG